MIGISQRAPRAEGFSKSELFELLDKSLGDERAKLKKVLIIPPDYTRYHSGSGTITQYYYHALKDTCHVDILPALGTHAPMTPAEIGHMYGDIPQEAFLVHNWRTDVEKIGEVPSEFVKEVSEGLVEEPIAVEVNRRLLDTTYDLILSVGQVVPHEVVGMANRNKNIFVGCGGHSMINSSHMLGAFYGMERIMGKDFSPVRKVFDYAEEHFFSHIPLVYVLTVTTATGDDIHMHGLYIGRERCYFEEAVRHSQSVNLILMDEPFEKVICNLDAREFKTTWIGNKAVYRTRMAIADGGELIVLAPGVERFGEDMGIDALIRKYGYIGREKILALCRENDDLKQNLSVAAHLIHASSDGRFKITYCTRHLTEAEVRGAGFDYMPYDEAVLKYNADTLVSGYNDLPNGEKAYYIPNPALGLWAEKARFTE